MYVRILATQRLFENPALTKDEDVSQNELAHCVFEIPLVNKSKKIWSAGDNSFKLSLREMK